MEDGKGGMRMEKFVCECGGGRDGVVERMLREVG